MKSGNLAPAIKLPDREGSLESKNLVVYFYPKDLTPGCTIEAIEFSKALPQIRKLGADVIGISGGTAESKEKFCKKFKLKIKLLADPDFAIAKEFGAYGTKSFMGVQFKGIHRKTFIVGKDRKILKVFDKVKVRGHAQEVIDFLESLNDEPKENKPKKRKPRK